MAIEKQSNTRNVRAFPRPQRIPLDRKNINAMLALAVRLGSYLLHAETDARGETVAYLEREPAQAVRS